MSKYAAFDAQLNIGTAQVITATVVVTTVTAGTAHFTLTAAGMSGSGDATDVVLSGGETAHGVAVLAAAALNAVPAYAAFFTIVANGDDVICTRKVAAANDGTMNLAYADDSSGGLTDDASSTATTAGIAVAEVAGVTNISGPGIALDTEDVTSHDSTSAFEEVVGTVLRSGEITLDIVYDPAGATHDATTGLNDRLENKTRSYFDLIFRSTYNWTFFGYITGFEPSAPVDGALTASVTIKIDGAPTLE